MQQDTTVKHVDTQQPDLPLFQSLRNIGKSIIGKLDELTQLCLHSKPVQLINLSFSREPGGSLPSKDKVKPGPTHDGPLPTLRDKMHQENAIAAEREIAQNPLAQQIRAGLDKSAYAAGAAYVPDGAIVSPPPSPSVGSKLGQLTNGVGMRQQFR